MWYHYKDSELIGIMKWDSLPAICHKWWEIFKEGRIGGATKKLNKEEFIFIDEALVNTDSFDTMQTCQMPYCMQFCDESHHNWDKYDTDEFYTDYGKDYQAFEDKWVKLSKKDRKYMLASWAFSETDEYLQHLRIYLDNLRQNLIKHPDTGYNEYIIYKKGE